MKLKSVLFILVVAVLFSCERKIDEEPVIMGYDYAPFEVGKYKIYEVDSVIYNIAATERVTTTHSFLKDEITELIIEENDTTYLIKRYYSESDSPYEWKYYYTWTAIFDNNRLITQDNNLKFVNMIFPVKQYSSWDGLAYITDDYLLNLPGGVIDIFKGWNYRYTRVADSDDFIVFGSNLAVISHVNDDHLLEKRFSEDVYAQGIGLVFRTMRIFDTQNINDDLSWEDKTENGFSIDMVIVDYN